MLYNDMIPVDTFDSTGTETNFCGPFSQKSGLYDHFESPYDTHALPAGGGSTAPELPIGIVAPSNSNSSGVPSSPLPGLGGTGYQQSGSGLSGGAPGGNIQQWLNPQNISAGLGLLTSVASSIGQNKSPEKATIKAICGRKPLFNIGGKKTRYLQCAQNYEQQQQMLQQQQLMAQQRQQSPANNSKIIIIVVVVSIILIAIIVTVIMLMKRNAAKTNAATK